MRILKHIVLLLFIARFYLLAEADRKAAEAVWLRTLQAPGLQEKPWGGEQQGIWYPHSVSSPCTDGRCFFP